VPHKTIIEPESYGVIRLDVDARRDIGADMAGSYVEAPDGIGSPRDSHRINQVSGSARARNILDLTGFLIDLEGRRNDQRLSDRHRKRDGTEPARLPVDGITSVAVFFSIGSTGAGIDQERELTTADDEQFCRYAVNIAVGPVLVREDLRHKKDHWYEARRQRQSRGPTCACGTRRQSALPWR
jgi:hypothetical protein